MTAARTPPRLARALLRRSVPEEARDSIDGDLHELYVLRRADSGAASAATWYWFQTLSFAFRFMLDHIVRFIRGIVSGNAAPSALDIKLGARMLAKSPGLALVGGLGMAVAVGLGAGGYAAVNSYFYPELPLNEGDRVIALAKFDRHRFVEDERLLHDFLVWRRDLRTVVDLGGFRTIRRNLISETGQGEPITIAEMTASGFRVARVPPLRGRVLVDDDERPGARPVMVIGYDVWQSRFGGNPSVVGREIRLGRVAHTIVGIMPETFAFPVNHQYWVPFRVDPLVSIAPGSGPDLDVFGRLARGATKELAQAELSVINRRLAAEGPKELAHLEARVVSFTDIFLRAEAGDNITFGVMRFFIALLLVVVATNVAVLVYARTVTRTGEIAVRTALGATRGRIVGQLFAEAFVLSALSSLVGLGIVAVGLRMFDRSLADFYGRAPFWIHSGLSWGTVLYALLLALLAAVIVGVLPALRATGAQLRAAMGSLNSGAKARLGPTWTALIVAQLAITVTILPMAMSKGNRIILQARQPAGFTSGEFLATRFVVEREVETTTNARADSAAADSAHAILTTLMARITTEPGVVGATITSSEPWEGGNAMMDVDGVEGASQKVRIITVDPSYFGLFGVRVVAGRTFTAADAALPFSDRPVIVNRTFVDEMLAGVDPVGRRIRYRNSSGEPQRWLTIGGVVEDFPRPVKTSSGGTNRMMYDLWMPGDVRSAMLTIRLRGQTPDAFTPTLRRIATSVDPMLQFSSTSALEATFEQYTRGAMQLAMLVALIAGSVLFLSAAGIHALMSFTVNQRRREIGIRTALGAPARSVLTSILSRATRQLAIGLGLGLIIVMVGDVMSDGELMEGAGLVVVPATAAFMLLVGLLAAAGPARRSLQVEPTETLRAE